MAGHEGFIKDWLTSLVATDGILITASLMILTILNTSTAMVRWQAGLIGALVLVASIPMMISAFYALDALGTLILHVKTEDSETKRQLSEAVRSRARKAELSFRASLILLLAAIILIVMLPNLTSI